jgi:hypothetical protein
MGIFDITPSIRLDTEAFNNALKELNLSKAQFNSQLRRAGVSLGDQRSKTNYLNRLLKDAGKPELRYQNVISSKPSEVLTKKGTVEVGMGGERPGQRGAPNNAKIWSDGTKVQKRAERLFKTVKEQRKYFVDQMQKIYKNVPKSKILNLFKNVVKGIKTASPMGIMQELAMDMVEKNPSLLSIMPGNQNTEPMTFNEGGMMNINEMTKPIGYANGGFENRMEMLKESMRDDENKRMRQPDVTSVALKIAQQQGDTSEANINKIIRQLMAMVPSVNQSMKDELTPTMSKGITSLLDKIGVMMGQKSDPRLNRNVGFSRVR